jgi:D-sedoheptulose 7-phosphate isomerase
MTEVAKIAIDIDTDEIEKIALELSELKKRNGRLFIIGLGGSASSSSHAVNDFRKICNIDAFTTDNFPEFTARANDDGWNYCFSSWLQANQMNENDILLINSVGGGSEEKNISVNLINAIKYANKTDAKVISIVGREDGFAYAWSDFVVVIPQVNKDKITPHSESFQSVVLHLLASHPLLKENQTKWESVK